MPEISVLKASQDGDNIIFKVEVKEGDTKTEHLVEVSLDYYNFLAEGKVTIEQLVEKSLNFLLEREPKESILTKFNLKKISYYFPEYEKNIKNYF
ncbi:MAG TPA: hypothetical protein VGA95_06390 [Thermodesulfobacteriota bacterium]|jgi:hypothetical protein